MRFRSRKWIAAILAAVVALAVVLCFGIVVCLDTIVADVSRDNVCTVNRDECFVDEVGTTIAYDAEHDDVLVAVHDSTVTLSAPTSFDDPPAAGTPVVLQRWEGGEVAWLIDLETGKRHGTSAFRSEAVSGLLFCLVVLTVVCSRTFTWLRGY